jgi:hypothetical protein
MLPGYASRMRYSRTRPAGPAWTRHIDECPANVLGKPPEQEALRGGVADAELLAWFRAGRSAQAATLAAADPQLEYATLIPARPRWRSGLAVRPTRG